MLNKYVIILSDKTLQTSLMEQQLTEKLDISIDVTAPSQLTPTSSLSCVDLVLIDFEQLETLALNQAIPNFDLLKLDVFIYNMPPESMQCEYVYWPSLKGVLLNNAPIEHLYKSVEYVLNGGLWLPRKCLEGLVMLRRNPNLERCQLYRSLTSRERQILDHVASGKSNKQIANSLFLSESTVKSHVYKIFKKLDVHKRKDAMHITNAMHNNYSHSMNNSKGNNGSMGDGLMAKR
ncbi:helix-turn-helix transcriptional regulator [Vibrio taketomensis]|uniref:helix-turn-helix transcriptional regulator n=1 Tax=Vibrio taketomensis TaxID=2572923 RepID=UPI001389946F|nr:response regulator transcription factor [Vibrio taketomensis]